jgi:hypothetical protein
MKIAKSRSRKEREEKIEKKIRPKEERPAGVFPSLFASQNFLVFIIIIFNFF